jgi:hypothetical protein
LSRDDYADALIVMIPLLVMVLTLLLLTVLM